MAENQDSYRIKPLIETAQNISRHVAEQTDRKMIREGIWPLISAAAAAYKDKKEEELAPIERQHREMHLKLLSVMFNVNDLVKSQDGSFKERDPEDVMRTLIGPDYHYYPIQDKKVPTHETLAEAAQIVRSALARYGHEHPEAAEKLVAFLDSLTPKLREFSQTARQVDTQGLAADMGERIAEAYPSLEKDIQLVTSALYHAANDHSRCYAVRMTSMSGTGESNILAAAISLQALGAAMKSVSGSGRHLAQEVLKAPAYLEGKATEVPSEAGPEEAARKAALMGELFERICPKGTTHLALISHGLAAPGRAAELLKTTFGISFTDSSGGPTVYDSPRARLDGTVALPQIPEEAVDIEKGKDGAVTYRLPQPEKIIFEAKYGDHTYPPGCKTY